jgi:hypothetical protein
MNQNSKLARSIKFLLFAALILPTTPEIFAQGPPINTDTPIMLGLEGRGVRTFAKFIRKATLFNDSEEIADGLDRRTTVRMAPLAIPYNLLSERFQVGVIVPFISIDSKSINQNISSFGLGDVRFFAKYLWLQIDRRQETFRVASKAGISFPTGNANKTPALGSGSTDYFFSTVAGWIRKRIGVYLESIYELNTSHSSIDYGNSFSYNLALGYRLLPAVYETYPSPQLNVYLEVNGTTAARNRINAVSNDNSGGTTIFLAPGLQYLTGRRWLFEGSLQIPVLNRPNGVQLATDWTASLGTRILLF